jgi:hypothetical protein
MPSQPCYRPDLLIPHRLLRQPKVIGNLPDAVTPPKKRWPTKAAGSQKRLTPTEMAEIILNDWTASVGIVNHF